MVESQHAANSTHALCSPPWRAIEFFAGIGGFAWAWPTCDIAVAIDIDQTARAVYRRHWPHPYLLKEIGSLSAESLAPLHANLWWLSPPCQPYSRRGQQRDVDDPRAASLLHLISLIPKLRPRAIALENVLGFGASRARARLEKVLLECNYQLATCELCPTELGWPNRRPRFYLLACLEPLRPWQPLPDCTTSVRAILEGALQPDELDGSSATDDQTSLLGEDVSCLISQRERALFGDALDRVDIQQPNAVTACFGSSYGKSLLHAGSYVITARDQWRRFTPREVARLLGYPPSFTLPADLSCRRAWKLLGNSLSIPVVRYVLSHLPNVST